MLTKRCTMCRKIVQIQLPDLKKKAIYLDQFMFSLIYNVKNDGNLPQGHEAFAKEVYRLLRRCVLLQQVFLPHSSIHHDETTVFHSSVELRGLYEFFGGDVRLRDPNDIELIQTLSFAKAFLDNEAPTLSFELDEVTDRGRDDWLPNFHIGVRVDYGHFADEIRKVRGKTHQEVKDLADQWTNLKPTFDAVLEKEFLSIGPSKIEAISGWIQRMSNPDPSDLMSMFNVTGRSTYREYQELCRFLKERGIEDQEEQMKQVMKFWHWERLREVPVYRISAYLFAAVARRVVKGEKKIIDQGLINDIRTISTYVPYVDAMFIDKRCATILNEEPLASDLKYRAKIFSLSSADAFIEFLKGIEAQATDDVRELAGKIYCLT